MLYHLPANSNSIGTEGYGTAKMCTFLTI